MAPRITINRHRGELQIWLNPEGRDLLVAELQRLSPGTDHFHIGDDYVPLGDKAYLDGAEVETWGKVFFRPDDWDAKEFPHVLEGAPDAGEAP